MPQPNYRHYHPTSPCRARSPSLSFFIWQPSKLFFSIMSYRSHVATHKRLVKGCLWCRHPHLQIQTDTPSYNTIQEANLSQNAPGLEGARQPMQEESPTQPPRYRQIEAILQTREEVIIGELDRAQHRTRSANVNQFPRDHEAGALPGQGFLSLAWPQPVNGALARPARGSANSDRYTHDELHSISDPREFAQPSFMFHLPRSVTDVVAVKPLTTKETWAGQPVPTETRTYDNNSHYASAQGYLEQYYGMAYRNAVDNYEVGADVASNLSQDHLLNGTHQTPNSHHQAEQPNSPGTNATVQKMKDFYNTGGHAVPNDPETIRPRPEQFLFIQPRGLFPQSYPQNGAHLDTPIQRYIAPPHLQNSDETHAQHDFSAGARFSAGSQSATGPLQPDPSMNDHFQAARHFISPDTSVSTAATQTAQECLDTATLPYFAGPRATLATATASIQGTTPSKLHASAAPFEQGHPTSTRMQQAPQILEQQRPPMDRQLNKARRLPYA